MALYSYKGFSRSGQKVTGTLDASSVSSVQQLLQQKGIFPSSIELAESATAGVSWWQSLFTPKISLRDKVLFTKQFSVLLKAGVPLVEALELLADQFEGPFHKIIIFLKDTVKAGESLAFGMKNFPAVFENIYVQLIKAGEASGKLELILDRLTVYLERKEELQSKIKGALMFPLIQVVVIVLVVIALMTFVVPKFEDMFASQGANLPWATQVLVSCSHFIGSYYLLLLAFLFFATVLFISWKKTQNGALIIDRVKLKIPIVKHFARLGAIVQFARTLGMLLEGGVNLSEALSIVSSIVDNTVLRTALNEAREKIVKQGNITQYLRNTGIFPPLATYLIATGEESGKLDSMLTMVGQIYERDLLEYSDQLTTLLNPIILLFMAVVVGFVVLSIALPMFNLASVIG